MRNKGFTLIELLVVIAILAILMVIALPNFIGMRDSARERAHEANIKILHDSATAFVLENPSTPVIWAPFENQEADPDIEITDTNMHDSWQKLISKWPANPMKTGSYVVEISETGKITVSPGVE
jgi:type IV pilus assembly protein PilA